MKPMSTWPIRRIRRIVDDGTRRVALLDCGHYRSVDTTPRRTIRCRPCRVLLDKIDGGRSAIGGRRR
jgi:hypothetical protein